MWMGYTNKFHCIFFLFYGGFLILCFKRVLVAVSGERNIKVELFTCLSGSQIRGNECAGIA